MTIVVCDNKMHQCGVEVQYCGQPSHYDDGANDHNFLMMETGKVSEVLDFDSEVTRLVVEKETG